MLTHFINNTHQALNFMQLQHDLLIACSHQTLPKHLDDEVRKANSQYSKLFIEQMPEKKPKRKKPASWKIKL